MPHQPRRAVSHERRRLHAVLDSIDESGGSRLHRHDIIWRRGTQRVQVPQEIEVADRAEITAIKTTLATQHVQRRFFGAYCRAIGSPAFHDGRAVLFPTM